MNEELWNNKYYKIVVTIEKRGLDSKVIEFGQEEGSKDGTIVFVIETAGKNIYFNILGINIESENIILIAAKEKIVCNILNANTKIANMKRMRNCVCKTH